MITHFIALKDSLRQLTNRVTGKGNGILDLAGSFLNRAVSPTDRSAAEKQQKEEIIQRLHDGGEFDKDLWIGPIIAGGWT